MSNDKNDPIVWLLLLERGRKTHDFQLAAQAQRELQRLGVKVIYGQRPRRRKGEPYAK